MERRIAPPEWLTDVVQRQESDERLDRVGEKMTETARPLTEGRMGQVLRGEWLGHTLHPMLTDLPIGFFTSSFVLDLVGGRSARTASRRLVGLGLLSTVPTAMAGAVDYSDASGDPRIRRVGAVHGLANLGAGLLYFRSWRSRRRGHHLRGVVWGLLGAGVMSFSGHLGGHLSFARGANVGVEPSERSTAGSGGPVVDITGDAAGRLLGIEEVAEVLGLSLADVEVMVEQKVLVPTSLDGESGFRPDDVEAARLRGG